MMEMRWYLSGKYQGMTTSLNITKRKGIYQYITCDLSSKWIKSLDQDKISRCAATKVQENAKDTKEDEESWAAGD